MNSIRDHYKMLAEFSNLNSDFNVDHPSNASVISKFLHRDSSLLLRSDIQ